MSAPASRPDTTRLQRLVHSYRDAAALMAAVELGLFTQVARGADTEAAVARALDLTADQRRAAGDGVRGAGPAGPRRRARPQRARRGALPRRGRADLRGPVDALQQAGLERVGAPRHAPAAPGHGRARQVRRGLHGRARAAIPRGDLLDRHGRGPALRAPGRPRGTPADPRPRRRLRLLLHRRRAAAPAAPRDRLRPAARGRGDARVHRLPRAGRPRDRAGRRLHARSTARRLRRHDHGEQPAAVQPRDHPGGHLAGLRRARARAARCT